MSKSSMLLTTLKEESGRKTFRLIPLTNDAVYMDVRFHTHQQMMTLVSKEKIEIFQAVLKADDNGNPVPLPGKLQQGNETQYKKERKLISSNYDYVLTNYDDMQKIVDWLTGESNDLTEYFVDDAPVSGTPTEPQLKVLDKDGN